MTSCHRRVISALHDAVSAAIAAAIAFEPCSSRRSSVCRSFSAPAVDGRRSNSATELFIALAISPSEGELCPLPFHKSLHVIDAGDLLPLPSMVRSTGTRATKPRTMGRIRSIDADGDGSRDSGAQSSMRPWTGPRGTKHTALVLLHSYPT